MHIELKKGVFLCSDERQFWIQKEWYTHRKDKEGKMVEVLNTKPLSGYCTELENLFDSYFDRTIRSSEAETVEQVVKEIGKVRRDIHKWLKELRGTNK